MLTREQRDELRRLVAPVEPGLPLHRDVDEIDDIANRYVMVCNGAVADLFVAAVNALPALLDDLDAAEKRAEAWEAVARELAEALLRARDAVAEAKLRFTLGDIDAALATFRAMEVLP